MTELHVQIVHLEPMRVASVHGFGPSPEGVAWERLFAWAKPRGLLESPVNTASLGSTTPTPRPAARTMGMSSGSPWTLR